MSLIKSQAIVGPSFDSGDKDLVVRLLTPGQGRMGVVVRGAKASLKGRAGSFQPLMDIEVTAYQREGSELATLREVAVLDSHDGLRADLGRLAVASYLLELALETSLPGHEAEDTFALTRLALAHLDCCDESPPVTAGCHWLLRLLALHGVGPSIDETLLSGAWKQEGTARTDQPARKPERFVLYLAEGLIAAAPGQPGARMPASEAEERRGARQRVNGPRAMTLPPAAVRALYENQRTESEALAALPALPPAAAADLLRALAALAVHHFDLQPRSWRFLETTVLKGTR